jgi:uncharacterized membrane protein YhaH (DUF805 family)
MNYGKIAALLAVGFGIDFTASAVGQASAGMFAAVWATCVFVAVVALICQRIADRRSRARWVNR